MADNFDKVVCESEFWSYIDHYFPSHCTINIFHLLSRGRGIHQTDFVRP